MLAAVSTSGIIFALLGFEQADQLAGRERATRKRDIPRAVIGSIVIGAIIYILLQVVFLAALPGRADRQAPGRRAVYTASAGRSPSLATLVGVGWLATILYIDAVISPGGTGLIYTTGASRVSYGLSRNGYVPKAFETTDRRGMPWVGLIAAFVVGCICFLPFPSWRSLVGLITSASVLMYAGAPLALGVFRNRLPEAERPYRLPGASVLVAARLRRREPPHPLVRLDDRLEARRRDPDRLRDPGRERGVQAEPDQARSSTCAPRCGCRSTSSAWA